MTATIVNPAETFQRVYCVNLDRRPDRWQRFLDGLPADWPFPAPLRVPACDGRLVPHPTHWRAGSGAWGCYRSHLRLIEDCMNQNVRSVLLLEDDAVFPSDFTVRVLDWLRHVPTDWQMIYLGGQHLKATHHPPIEVGPGIWQPYNVNRTHAWAIAGSGLRAVYSHLVAKDWVPTQHIDHRLGVLHQQRKLRIYCPPAWLVAQDAGKSNISGREFPEARFFPPAAELAIRPRGNRREGPGRKPPAAAVPCVAILGTHSSGSSALAGALWHCGLFFGRQAELTGYWGRQSPARGGEHRQLARICETAWPFRSVKPAKPPRWVRRQLTAFVRTLRQQAAAVAENDATRSAVPRMVGLKYPQLALAGPQLRTVCGPGLRLLICDRPLEESIASLVRRTNAGETKAAAIGAHQRWIAAGRDNLANAMPGHTMHVDYAQLCADPLGTLTRICTWLDLQPTADQLAAAAATVRRQAPLTTDHGPRTSDP